MLTTKVSYTRSQIQTKSNKKASLKPHSWRRRIHIAAREHRVGAVARVCVHVCGVGRGGDPAFQSVQNAEGGEKDSAVAYAELLLQ